MENETLDIKLLETALNTIKTPENFGDDDEMSAISYIKGVIEETIVKNDFDRDSIIKRIRVATGNLFPDLAENLEVYMPADIKDEDVESELATHKRWLFNYINKTNLKTNVGRLYSALARNDVTVIEKEIGELKVAMDKNANRSGSRRIPGLINSINSKDPSSFSIVIKKSQETSDGAALKTPFRSINRMMGKQNGITNELVLMPALPFNGKTLFSQSIFLGMGAVNHVDDFKEHIPGDKEPMFLDLSFENTPEINIPQAFETMYGNLEGKSGEDELKGWREEAYRSKLLGVSDTIIKPEDKKIITKLSEKELKKFLFDTSMDKEAKYQLVSDVMKESADKAGEYMTKTLGKNGWVYQFDQILNTEFEIEYLPDLIKMYEDQGYHIMGIRGDYLGTIKKVNLGNGIAGSDIKESYRTARNYTVLKNKFALLPHQLSSEAKRFKAVDPSGFIKNLPGKGYYEYCSSLDNEADKELYFGMTDQEGRRFLEVMRGKDRAGGKTKPVDHYTVIPLDDVRILPWDELLDDELSKRSLSDFASGGGLGDWGSF